MVEQRFCKAKAIGSNPLAGFLVQILSEAVGTMGLGDWGKPLEPSGLINGLTNSEKASNPNLLWLMPEGIPIIELRDAKASFLGTAARSE